MSKASHVRARSAHPHYPPRFTVENAKVLWQISCKEYEPVSFTHPTVVQAAGKWADPDFESLDDASRFALSQRISLCKGNKNNLRQLNCISLDGMPLNPIGRTGMSGRGLLGRYGPNYAADPIVTRVHPEDTNVLQMVVITRRDTGEDAIPGGMVELGDKVSHTLRKEFFEEALRLCEGNADMTKEIAEELNCVFDAGGEFVYSGYVDDPRNTDNAWIETEVRHFHLKADLAAKLPLKAGDDAANVKWVDITPDMELYASHKDWVNVVHYRSRTRAVCNH